MGGASPLTAARRQPHRWVRRATAKLGEPSVGRPRVFLAAGYAGPTTGLLPPLFSPAAGGGRREVYEKPLGVLKF